MTEIKQVRLSGFGGQGIVLAGVLLGQAGAIEGRFVAGSNSYGAQARGSSCKSEIVFSEGPIQFPHLTIADILIVMAQGSYNIHCEDVRETSGFILYDDGLVKPKETLKVKQIGIPATELAMKELNNKQVANLLMMGTVIEKTKIVSSKAFQKAIALHIGERFRSLNLKAFQLGIELGKKIHG